jgi:UDP-glucose 4-epimerase
VDPPADVTETLLITGGAGFIGSHLVERLVDARADVAVVDNLSRGERHWVPAGVPLHEADIRDLRRLRRIVGIVRPTSVVHLAAMHFVPAVDDAPALAREVNVDGTQNLLRALAPAPPELLLFASTAAVYPDRSGRIPESCAVGPFDVYGETKVEGERLVADFERGTGTRSIVARLFNVIGRRETNPHVVPELVTQVREGRTPIRLGALHPKRDYTDVVDVAAALARLLGPLDEDASVFNVGTGRGTSVADLVASCERIVGYELIVESDPRRVRRRDRAELVADVSLLRGTGWAPTRTLEQTLRDLLTE